MSVSSFTTVAYRVAKRALGCTILLLVVGTFGNWFFALSFAKGMLAFDRWLGRWGGGVVAVVILLLFVVVFPVLYWINGQAVLVSRAIGTLLDEYKDEFLSFIITRAVKTSLRIREQGGEMLTTSSHWFVDLPLVVRRVMKKIKERIPYFTQVEEALAHIDRDKQWTEEELEQQVTLHIQTSLDEVGKTFDIGFIWWLIGANMLCMLLVYVVIALI